jgi:hypothetical protein
MGDQIAISPNSWLRQQEFQVLRHIYMAIILDGYKGLARQLLWIDSGKMQDRPQHFIHTKHNDLPPWLELLDYGVAFPPH